MGQLLGTLPEVFLPLYGIFVDTAVGPGRRRHVGLRKHERGIAAQIARKHIADGIYAVADGVDALMELHDVLAYVLLAHALLVEAVEIGVEGNEYLLVEEGLAAKGDVAVARALLAEVFKLLPLEKNPG